MNTQNGIDAKKIIVGKYLDWISIKRYLPHEEAIVKIMYINSIGDRMKCIGFYEPGSVTVKDSKYKSCNNEKFFVCDNYVKDKKIETGWYFMCLVNLDTYMIEKISHLDNVIMWQPLDKEQLEMATTNYSDNWTLVEYSLPDEESIVEVMFVDELGGINTCEGFYETGNMTTKDSKYQYLWRENAYDNYVNNGKIAADWYEIFKAKSCNENMIIHIDHFDNKVIMWRPIKKGK